MEVIKIVMVVDWVVGGRGEVERFGGVWWKEKMVVVVLEKRKEERMVETGSGQSWWSSWGLVVMVGWREVVMKWVKEERGKLEREGR